MRDFHTWSLFLLPSFITGVISSGIPPTLSFLNVNVSILLPENVPIHSTVYTVLATDPEADNLTYGKVSQSPSLPDFQLNTRNGELYSPSGIDAEATNIFYFKFDVSDGTSRVQSAQLNVTILDVNDNIPWFTSDSYNITITNNIANGTPIYQVTARDADITSVLTYFIKAGNTPQTFHVNNSGWIAIVNANYLVANSDFSLQVQASDGTFSNTTNVYISVVEMRASMSTSTAIPTTSNTNMPVAISANSTKFNTNNTLDTSFCEANQSVWIVLCVVFGIIVLNMAVVILACSQRSDLFKIFSKDILPQGKIRNVIGILMIITAGAIVFLYLFCKYGHRCFSNNQVSPENHRCEPSTKMDKQSSATDEMKKQY